MRATYEPPAFPVPMVPYGHLGEVTNVQYTGMTLRDYFAAKALQSLSLNGLMGKSDADIASEVYGIADAMMIEREKEG